MNAPTSFPERFLVRVTGTTPYAFDYWTKPYRSLPAAKAQATRMTHTAKGDKRGDFAARVYRLDFSPAWVSTHVVPQLTEVAL